LDRLGIYLKSPVFDHGLLYVAFSRVRSIEDVRALILNTYQQGILTEDPKRIFKNNIVFREILEAFLTPEQSGEQELERIRLLTEAGCEEEIETEEESD
jgi:hypothetical protein